MTKLMRTTSCAAFAIVGAVSLAAMPGCATAPKTEAKQQTLQDQGQATVQRFKAADPSLDNLLNNAYGYAIFPSVGKGGLIVGGAYGRGTVYRQGKFIGYADLTQGTVGAQLGGQTYAEMIVFKDQNAMQKFLNNQFALSAEASAVAIKPGAAVAHDFTKGVKVFTDPNGGLMAAATVGGQKFTFVSSENAPGEAVQASATTQP